MPGTSETPVVLPWTTVATRGFASWRWQIARAFQCVSAISVWTTCGLMGQGIPEPDLVMYGVIRDVGANARVTVGQLIWTFQPSAGGEPVVVASALENINDQFSYILRVRCETALAGIANSPGVLRLGTSYDRGQVTVAGVEAAFTELPQEQLSLAPTDRGRIERVDLQVSLGQPAVLPEAWQMQYFGQTGIDPFDDADQDGVNNFDEYRAGTHPRDPESLFEVNVGEDLAGSPRLEWISASGKNYTVYRSIDLTTGFEVLAAGIPATPPRNVFSDETAAGGIYFYRVQVDVQTP